MIPNKKELIVSLQKIVRPLMSRGVVVLSIFSLTLYSMGGFSFSAFAAQTPQVKQMQAFVLTGAYSLPGGQPTGEGEVKNGNAGEYPEGACVPVILEVENRVKDGQGKDYLVEVSYDHYSPDVYGILSLEAISSSLSDPVLNADNLNDFSFTGTDFTTATSFSTVGGYVVTSTVEGPYADETGTSTITVTDSVRHYNVSLFGIPQDETVNVLFCARLGNDASEYNGASMSIRLAANGNQNVPIQASGLLALPSLTIQKIVEGGSASASDFSFTVTPEINGGSVYSILNGSDSVTIENVMDGTYSITESTGQSGYTLTNGAGTNCVFVGETASASVTAGNPATDATCIFTNTHDSFVEPVMGTSTLIVYKNVVNDDGGTATASDFTMHVTGTNPSITDFPGDASGTTVIIDAGDYAVTEDEDPNYQAMYTDENCFGTIAAGETVTCTITNDDIAVEPGPTTSTLIVYKSVVNDDGGTATAGDFMMHVTGTNPSITDFPGDASGTVVTIDAGDYAVTEDTDSDYMPVYHEDCSGTVAAGDTVFCVVVNDDIASDPEPTTTTSTLIVYKTVVNDDGGTAMASDFMMHVTGTNPSITSFSGNASGTTITVDAGDYAVTEDEDPNYQAIYTDENCFGTIAAGETVTCTITNDDISQSEGEPSGVTADLSIDKSTPSWIVFNEEQFWYTLTVTNIGPDAATGVSVSDQLPGTVEYVTSTASQGTYVSSTGIWQIGNMALNQTETLQILVRVAANAGTNLLNSATVSALEIDPNSSNNSDSASSDVIERGGSSNGGGDCGLGCGSTGGGGTSSNPPTPPTTPPQDPVRPEPVVLGSTDEQPQAQPEVQPEPVVLGATDEQQPELPRTGSASSLPAIAAILGLSVALAVSKEKKRVDA